MTTDPTEFACVLGIVDFPPLHSGRDFDLFKVKLLHSNRLFSHQKICLGTYLQCAMIPLYGKISFMPNCQAFSREKSIAV